MKLSPDAYIWENPLLSSYQCIIGVASAGNTTTQIELGDSFLRNYEITFDFSAVGAPTTTGYSDDPVVSNTITFAVSTYAPTGTTLLKNLDEYFPDESGMGLGGLVGLLQGLLFALAILTFVLW